MDNDACMTLSPVDADVSFLQENTCSGQVAGYFAEKNMLSCVMIRFIGKNLLH